MKKYLIFIGTFILSILTAYLFFIGIILLLIDKNSSFANQPPSLIMMFIVFFAIPALVSYYVAFELKKPKKIKEKEDVSANVAKEHNTKEQSHWLFALIASIAIIGGIVGLLFIFPPIKIAPYSFIEVNDNEFKKNTTPSPTQIIDQASNWKTYTNSQYNFSVSYPKDFFINESSTKEYDTFNVTISDAQKLSQFSNNNISINIIVTNKSYKGYKNNYNSCCAYGWITTVFNSMINSPIGTQYKEMTKVKNATIGGVKGIIFEVNQAHVDETMSIPSLYAAFKKDEKALLINGITGDRKLIFQDPYKHIFDQILQTFKFNQ